MSTWPKSLSKRDLLYVAADLDDELVKHLVLFSSEKGASYVRDNGAWAPLEEDALDDLPVYYVKLPFVRHYDEQEAAGKEVTVKSLSRFVDRELSPVTAAAPAGCPPATQDVSLNLRNRENAIKSAAYGPLNPKLPNTEFWAKKADRWTVSPRQARQSLCGNCAAFIVTAKMLDCIADGLKQGGGSAKDAWSTVEAGELGYCEAFDFKCAASRTCDAWITGGPVTGD
jgi:hypothetical protein